MISDGQCRATKLHQTERPLQAIQLKWHGTLWKYPVVFSSYTTTIKELRNSTAEIILSAYLDVDRVLSQTRALHRTCKPRWQFSLLQAMIAARIGGPRVYHTSAKCTSLQSNDIPGRKWSACDLLDMLSNRILQLLMNWITGNRIQTLNFFPTAGRILDSVLPRMLGQVEPCTTEDT